jgi:rhamnosyltransferase
VNFQKIDSLCVSSSTFSVEGVYAVVVTHRPDLIILFDNLKSCRLQVNNLVVVDNGSDRETQEKIKQFVDEIGFESLLLNDNLGVAVAQNLGIAMARSASCRFVLLLDQDSAPQLGMVKALCRTSDDLSDQGIHVAAVGPRLIDRRTGECTPFVSIHLLGVTRRTYKRGDEFAITTDFLISSGMMIPLSVLDHVGLPEEGLFIDNVDLEWCFRARGMGYRLYGVGDAVMEHAVGDRVTKIGGRVIYRHSPLRQYYMMRNRISLYQRSYSPWGWIIHDFFRLLFKLVVFSLIFAPRRENIKMMFIGVRDGVMNKMGRFR